MLRPLATSCAKDYKGHSLVQTSFTELPNSKGWLCHRRPTGGGYLPHTWRLPPSLMWKPDATSKQQHVGGLWLEAELVRHRKTVTTQPFQLENLISTLSTRKALKVKASENLSGHQTVSPVIRRSVRSSDDKSGHQMICPVIRRCASRPSDDLVHRRQAICKVTRRSTRSPDDLQGQQTIKAQLSKRV